MSDISAAPQLPLFYKKPVTVQSDVHRDLTVSPSEKGFSFAAETHTVILSAAEFIEAGHEYPIIFSVGAEQSPVPLALLGLAASENLFVDDSGKWSARYIPAYVRRYPFIPADTGGTEFPVCIDEAFDGLNKAEGQRLFDEDGSPTDYCRFVQSFVSDAQQQYLAGQAFVARIHELDLFRLMDANVKLKNGADLVLREFLIVDEDKLGRLSDSDVLDLFRKGYLPLIYAHLSSLKNISKLADLKVGREPSTAG